MYLLTGWYGSRTNTDVAAAGVSAWRLGTHGTLDLSGYHGPVTWAVHVGDAVFTNRFPGVIASAAPFYLALGNASRPTVAPATIAAACWTAAAVTLAMLVFERLTSRRGAVLAAGVLAFATPTWTVSADALWTHGPNQFWIMAGLLFLSSNRAFASGACFGASILVRPHMAVAAAVIGVTRWATARDLRRFVLFAAACSAGAMALLVYNRLVFQHWGVLGGYNSSHLRPGGVGGLGLLVNVPGALLSPHRGILILTPFLWLLIPGLPRAWRTAPAWAKASALGGVAYTLVQLYLLPFMGGHGFYSYRTMIEPLTLMSPFLVVAYNEWAARTPVRRTAFFALVWLSFSFHAFGAILDHHRPESSNPFRTFSAWPVAQQVGPWVTSGWLIATAMGLWLVVRAVNRQVSPLSDGGAPAKTIPVAST